MGRAHHQRVIPAVEFINKLTHTKGQWAGHSFSLRPWQQRKIVDPLFGTLTRDGRRRYRICYVEIPRKNGKTELAAAIALYMLLADGEMGAEVYSAAHDLNQASLAFDVASQMVRNDRDLSSMLEIVPSRKRIVHYQTGSFYRALPAEAAGSHGFNASAIIADELHAWTQTDRELLNVLMTSTGSRRQPLTFIITTAGWDRNSVCWEFHRQAERVLAGESSDRTFLPVLYGAPPGADWTDEKVWKAANPALGDFRDLDEMRQMAQRAKEMPAQENVFRRLYLCQWTEQSERAMPMDQWDACGRPLTPTEGRACWGGLDLSTTTDLTAFVLLFRDGAGAYDVLPHFWVPEVNLRKRAERDGVPYDEWNRRGFLTTTDGDVIDYDVVRADILRLAEKYQIQEIAYDPWNASQIVTQLQSDGATMIPYRQGFASMAAPTKELFKLVAAGELRHAGHPVLRWMASNLAVKQDPAGNQKPNKATSGDRIDGIVALCMALGRAILTQDGSVYDTRGALIL